MKWTQQFFLHFVDFQYFLPVFAVLSVCLSSSLTLSLSLYIYIAEQGGDTNLDHDVHLARPPMLPKPYRMPCWLEHLLD